MSEAPHFEPLLLNERNLKKYTMHGVPVLQYVVAGISTQKW